ncbi:MAG: DUF721 domain-containing protein [Muribaculaceae bacterium]|nr:DUF721 domain-containing protein [Muribaculaceae bacterium]
MKRTNAQSIGEIIDAYLQHENLRQTFDEHQAAALWPSIVGPAINRYTVSREVRDGILYITLSSAALRNELSLNRTQLLELINGAVGQPVIKEIRFR